MGIKYNNSDDFLLNVDNTGKIPPPKYQTIQYPFDKYIIEVKVDSNNNFVGIDKITINKTFLNGQNIKSNDVHDFDEYFKEQD